MSHNYAHVFFLYQKIRSKKKNYHLNLKNFSKNLTFFLEKSLKEGFNFINNLGNALDVLGNRFLFFLNLNKKLNVLLTNKSIIFQNISLVEEALKLFFDSNISNIKKQNRI